MRSHLSARAHTHKYTLAHANSHSFSFSSFVFSLSLLLSWIHHWLWNHFPLTVRTTHLLHVRIVIRFWFRQSSKRPWFSNHSRFLNSVEAHELFNVIFHLSRLCHGLSPEPSKSIHSLWGCVLHCSRVTQECSKEVTLRALYPPSWASRSASSSSKSL